MLNLWNEHCNLIASYCDIKVRTATAIWYYEDGASYGVCELRNGRMFSCNSREEFDLIVELGEA